MAKKLKFIDLFAGIGGLRQGFEDENTTCVFSSEWDAFSKKTYEANFGEIPHGDITKIAESEIPKHDILLAGFPCQPFSSIGKREGFLHETQGTLFFDVLRIVKYHKPKMFLLECKRLMGFSDEFKVPVSRTQMYRQFGNSVAIPVIKAVADEMKKALNREN